MEPLCVVIAARDPFVREGLRVTLGTVTGVLLVRIGAIEVSLPAWVRRHRPAAVVVNGLIRPDQLADVVAALDGNSRVFILETTRRAP